MIHYVIMKNCLESLDPKYKEQVNITERAFFASNYINMLDYYKIYNVRKSDYKLKHKFDFENLKRTLDLLTEYIRHNSFHNDLIGLAYGYVVNLAYNEVIQPYLDSLTGIEKKVTSRKDKIINKINRENKARLLYNLNLHFQDAYYVERKDITPTNEEELLIKEIFVKIHQFSYGLDVAKKSYVDFYHFNKRKMKFKFFLRPYLSFVDTCSKSKIFVRMSTKKKLKKQDKLLDYKNSKCHEWYNFTTKQYLTDDFDTLINKATQKANTYIEALNQAIFYNNKRDLRLCYLTRYTIPAEVKSDNLFYSINSPFTILPVAIPKIKKVQRKEIVEIKDISTLEDIDTSASPEVSIETLHNKYIEELKVNDEPKEVQELINESEASIDPNYVEDNNEPVDDSIIDESSHQLNINEIIDNEKAPE